MKTLGDTDSDFTHRRWPVPIWFIINSGDHESTDFQLGKNRRRTRTATS